MKYSIIIPYRDRKEHLEILLPCLFKKFEGKNYEIIVSEQDDRANFQIACVENVGFNHSNGDVVIFHQVDYCPSEDVSYEVDKYPVLPAKQGIFLSEDMSSIRDINDIPGGYRRWSQEIDPNFYGGVIAMKRWHFQKINGFNPMYRGWGNEDEDIRERFKWAGIPVVRNEVGTFYILHHKDNCPKPEEARFADFMEGRRLLMNAERYKHIGYESIKYDSEEYVMNFITTPPMSVIEQMKPDAILEYKTVRWIKSRNYQIDENYKPIRIS